MIGIYRIINIINGKSYIGQSKNIEKRWEQHDKMLFANKHHSKKLQRDFNLFGPNVFIKIVLKTYPCYDKGVLDKDEKMFIQIFNSYYRGYNCTLGG